LNKLLIDKEKLEATMLIHSKQAIYRTTSHLTRRMLLSTATEASTTTAATTTATTTKETTATTSPDKKKKKRIVVAVGGNALQRRGDRLTIENMLVRMGVE
jgi:CBS-domain-containing membrane protein